MTISAIEQLRHDIIVHPLNAWRAGGDGRRWPGDDGEFLDLTERELWPDGAEPAYLAKVAELKAEFEVVKTGM